MRGEHFTADSSGPCVPAKTIRDTHCEDHEGNRRMHGCARSVAVLFDRSMIVATCGVVTSYALRLTTSVTAGAFLSNTRKGIREGKSPVLWLPYAIPSRVQLKTWFPRTPVAHELR